MLLNSQTNKQCVIFGKWSILQNGYHKRWSVHLGDCSVEDMSGPGRNPCRGLSTPGKGGPQNHSCKKKPPKAAVCVQYQLFIGDVGVVKAHSFPMSLTGCPELQSAEMFFFVYVSNQRPFCFEIGSQTIIALLPSLFSWGKNVLNLTWSFPRFSWVSTEAIRPLPCILWQRYLQSSGFVTLCVEKSWMLENSLQRSSTDTSVHLETPWRLQELFVQERKSPSCFPQSSPAVLETIFSSDIKPENTFTLVTLTKTSS